VLDRARDEALIRHVEELYDRAWQQGDVEALIACLTEDAVLVNPRGDLARGRVEIRRALGDFLAGEARGSRHLSEISRVEFVTDDVAVVDGEAHLTELGPVDSGGPSSMSHLFTDVLVRTGDGWAIAHVRAYALADR
jgi:uncharacterized protein (TIGR02246 family)